MRDGWRRVDPARAIEMDERITEVQIAPDGKLLWVKTGYAGHERRSALLRRQVPPGWSDGPHGRRAGRDRRRP